MERLKVLLADQLKNAIERFESFGCNKMSECYEKCGVFDTCAYMIFNGYDKEILLDILILAELESCIRNNKPFPPHTEK